MFLRNEEYGKAHSHSENWTYSFKEQCSNDKKKVVNRKYRLKIMGASVPSDSGIGPDKLLLFNFLEERDKRPIK